MSYALFTTDLTSFLAFSVKANKHIHEGPLLDTIVTTLHFYNTQTTLIFHLQKPSSETFAQKENDKMSCFLFSLFTNIVKFEKMRQHMQNLC